MFVSFQLNVPPITSVPMTKPASIKNVSVHVCMAIPDVVKMPNVMIKIIELCVHVLRALKATRSCHVFVVYANIMKTAQITKPVTV